MGSKDRPIKVKQGPILLYDISTSESCQNLALDRHYRLYLLS